MALPRGERKRLSGEDGRAVRLFVPGMYKKRVWAAGDVFGTVKSDDDSPSRLTYVITTVSK